MYIRILDTDTTRNDTILGSLIGERFEVVEQVVDGGVIIDVGTYVVVTKGEYRVVDRS